jgi:hypothetical protein
MKMNPCTKAWHRAGGDARAKKLSARKRRAIARSGGSAVHRCTKCHRQGHNRRTCPRAS